LMEKKYDQAFGLVPTDDVYDCRMR